jgi:hypothetical protein
LKFIVHLEKEFKNDENYFKKADTEIIEYYLEFIIKDIE